MELNIDEVLRYLGMGDHAPESMRATAIAVAHRLMNTVQPRYTYRVCSLTRTDGVLYLPEADILLPGAYSQKILVLCDQVVLLACTLGAQF